MLQQLGVCSLVRRRNWISPAIIAIMALLGCALDPSLLRTPRSAGATPTAKPRVKKEPKDLFALVSPSVVVVEALDPDGKPSSLGSGVTVGTDLLVSNCHVVRDSASLQIRQGKDMTKAATVRFADVKRDLCVLSVPDLGLPAVELGAVGSLQVGDKVYAVGNPQGLESTLSEGLVSGLRDAKEEKYLQADSGTLVQTSSAVSPGSSGGGLFNEFGELVGIVSFQLIDGQNLNFALPADWVKEEIDQAAAVASAQTVVLPAFDPLDGKRPVLFGAAWYLLINLADSKYYNFMETPKRLKAKLASPEIWDQGQILLARYRTKFGEFCESLETDVEVDATGPTILLNPTESGLPLQIGRYKDSNTVFVGAYVSEFTLNIRVASLARRVAKNFPTALSVARKFAAKVGRPTEVDTLAVGIIYGSRDFVSETASQNEAEIVVYRIGLDRAKDFQEGKATAADLARNSQAYVVARKTAEAQLAEIDPALLP